ncbi:hypothetical protein WT72_17935 [Burkholderia pseudomultivorans]|uniref:Alpha 1,4-glycosyltransferase domain-containing protein n=1 Tax=Burkholderia pseudomultivorans TaxID=1207504 RepID=A0A132ESI3_9BURK|nr:hypothetical protein [Burkholderia pseudomultivorans]KVG61330.1 hypothetical protein WS80_01260 [Burkholderia pseudomultivorans]KWF58059.1 hypothetical protein WT57_29635 [Burkholderia pseudomultivorans]KWI54663.1 hypothetical protein WT72_17935 [Burkholderia pseudomultivorans]
MTQVKFASFWHGPELSPYETACLNSFAAYGNEVSLYSYEEIRNLPEGIVAKDASTITSRDTLNAFPVNGVPSMAHFTDYFRFMMFTKTDEIWVDTDILLLRDFDLGDTRNLIGREDPIKICNAILRLDSDDPRLHDTIRQIEAMKGTPIQWGETGPLLLTKTYGIDAGLPQNFFYPVHYDDYYKVFLPEHFDECAALCADSYTLHLWNNRLVKMGLFKKIGPPVGSFLHHVFGKFGANALFTEFYPADIMKIMTDSATDKVGRDDGIRKLLQIGVPVMKGAIRRRLMPSR